VVARVEGKTRRSVRKTATWLRGKGVPVSRETVRRTLRAADLKPYHRLRQQKLTEKQKRRRVSFAREFKDHDWNTTLMTDETEFQLVPRGNTRNDVVWVHSADEVPPLEQDAYSASLRFWAGVSAFGRTSLHFYPGTLNAQKYRDILNEALPEMRTIFGHRDWTFMHDGAPAHSERKTNEWLEDNVPHHITSGPSGEWPAKSPDLNWIENLFGVMSEKVSEPSPPVTVAALKTRLRKIWNEIPDETLQRCANGMPERLEEIVRVKGCALKN
jgi:hypothetical protein